MGNNRKISREICRRTAGEIVVFRKESKEKEDFGTGTEIGAEFGVRTGRITYERYLLDE